MNPELEPEVPFQIWLLLQLATYRFLCPSQFWLIGIDVCDKTLRQNLKSLKERKLCEKTSYRYSPKYGRKEDVWHLLPKGKDYLLKFADIEELEIKMPIGKVKAIEEYQHRKMTISAHIILRQVFMKNGIGFRFLYYDFEKRKKTEGRGYEGATKLKAGGGFLKSDAIFLVQHNQTNHIFCLEIHNQYRVGKIIKQMKPYAYCLSEGSCSSKFGIEKSPRVLIVFEKESTMRAALELAALDTFYLYMRDYFLFKTYHDLMIDPIHNRLNLKKETTSLFTL